MFFPCNLKEFQKIKIKNSKIGKKIGKKKKLILEKSIKQHKKNKKIIGFVSVPIGYSKPNRFFRLTVPICSVPISVQLRYYPVGN